MRKLNKSELEIANKVINHFIGQVEKALDSYHLAGVKENHPVAGKPLQYYSNALKYLFYMRWSIDPNKKQAGRRKANGKANPV